MEILHVDEDLVVVNKPPSIPVHPIGRFRVSDSGVTACITVQELHNWCDYMYRYVSQCERATLPMPISLSTTSLLSVSFKFHK